MDSAATQSLSVEQLIRSLLVIILELCSRFHISNPAVHSNPMGSTPLGLEQPPIPSPRNLLWYMHTCYWCSRDCVRTAPSLSNHACWAHKDLRDGSGASSG
jgi:hypothetical protein